MINKVTNLAKEYKPLKETNGIFTVSFQKENLYDEDKKGNKVPNGYATWYEIAYKYKPSTSEIKRDIEEFYNKQTRYNIEKMFVWNEKNVELSETDQANYKAAWDLCYQTDGGNLPVIFKFKKYNKNVFYTFASKEDLQDFYLSMNKHISETLNNGWRLKEAVDYNLYK